MADQSIPEAVPPEADVTAPTKKPKGGKARLRLFLTLLHTKECSTPAEAFLKAGFPVKGVNSNSGWLPEQVGERAAALLRSTKAQAILARWTISLPTAMASLGHEAVATFSAGLNAKLKDGRPDWNTRARMAENIADRIGLSRRSSVQIDRGGAASSVDRERNEQAAREVNELLEMQRQGDQFSLEEK